MTDDAVRSVDLPFAGTLDAIIGNANIGGVEKLAQIDADDFLAQAASAIPYGAPTRRITGTTGTIGQDDDYTLIVTTSDSPITLTLDKTAGTNAKSVNVMVRQLGLGQVTFVTQAGAPVLASFGGFTKTGGQWAIVVLQVVSNADGASAQWTLDGQGA